jgi:small basic protein
VKLITASMTKLSIYGYSLSDFNNGIRNMLNRKWTAALFVSGVFVLPHTLNAQDAIGQATSVKLRLKVATVASGRLRQAPTFIRRRRFKPEKPVRPICNFATKQS